MDLFRWSPQVKFAVTGDRIRERPPPADLPQVYVVDVSTQELVEVVYVTG